MIDFFRFTFFLFSSKEMRSIQVPICLNDPNQVDLYNIFNACIKNNWKINQLPSIQWSCIVNMAHSFQGRWHDARDNLSSSYDACCSDSHSVFNNRIRDLNNAKEQRISKIFMKLNLIKCNPQENLSEIAEALLLICHDDFLYSQYEDGIKCFISLFKKD
jgi:hypothetical protein